MIEWLARIHPAYPIEPDRVKDCVFLGLIIAGLFLAYFLSGSWRK